MSILLISIYLITEPTLLKEERVTVKDVSVEQNKCSLKTKFTLINNEEISMVVYVKMVGDGVTHAVNFYALEPKGIREELELSNLEVCTTNRNVNIIIEDILEEIQKEAIAEEEAIREAVG